jgi:Holliday junction resolvase RusA-like endonuclease
MDKLVLPLCPSINNYWIQRKGTGYRIKSPEAQAWLEMASFMVKAYCRKNGIKSIDRFYPIWLTWYLPRTNADSHNYLKGTLDSLELGGLFMNDKYILNRTKDVYYDKKYPRVEIEIMEV